MRSLSNFAPKDWYEATNVCAAEGKDLCGVEEPCSRSGCSYDRHYQWTGEECQAGDEGLPAECGPDDSSLAKPTPTPAPTTKPFPTCGVRITRGRWQDKNNFQCVTDPMAFFYAEEANHDAEDAIFEELYGTTTTIPPGLEHVA